MAAPLCECGGASDESQRSYAQCCRPIHRNERRAEAPARLVRARFCAFARRELDFLWRTLHPHHPDRQLPEEEFRRTLRQAFTQLKYVRLHVIEQREPEVLFLAELYEKGKERSFLEKSFFARDQGEWKYLRGTHRSCSVRELASLRWE